MGHISPSRDKQSLSYAEARLELDTGHAPISCRCCGTVSDVGMCVCRSREVQLRQQGCVRVALRE